MVKGILEKTKAKMKKVIENLNKDFASLRTGRASLAILDGITVDYHGTQMPLNQVATLSSPDAQTLTIAPWEQSMIKHIEHSIQKSDLGISPNNDGKIIRLGVPPLTEERRKQLVKVAKKHAEESRVSIRNVRRDANEELKKSEKMEHISEDETKKGQKDVQSQTDKFIEQIDSLLANKEKEIMEV
ncbi:MAG: ribosome recycling factor [Nitrospirae bacterium]|nr:ribosome recycling factor [Nitrospirota bacterium]